MAIKVNVKHLSSFLNDNEFQAIAPQVKLAHDTLHNGTGLGNDFIGWVTLPTDYDKEEFARIKAAAKKIQSDTDVFIVIGIGGSRKIRRTFISPETASVPRRWLRFWSFARDATSPST